MKGATPKHITASKNPPKGNWDVYFVAGNP
jgi:hypothetical protein